MLRPRYILGSIGLISILGCATEHNGDMSNETTFAESRGRAEWPAEMGLRILRIHRAGSWNVSYELRVKSADSYEYAISPRVDLPTIVTSRDENVRIPVEGKFPIRYRFRRGNRVIAKVFIRPAENAADSQPDNELQGESTVVFYESSFIGKSKTHRIPDVTIKEDNVEPLVTANFSLEPWCVKSEQTGAYPSRTMGLEFSVESIKIISNGFSTRGDWVINFRGTKQKVNRSPSIDTSSEAIDIETLNVEIKNGFNDAIYKMPKNSFRILSSDSDYVYRVTGVAGKRCEWFDKTYGHDGSTCSDGGIDVIMQPSKFMPPDNVEENRLSTYPDSWYGPALLNGGHDYEDHMTLDYVSDEFFYKKQFRANVIRRPVCEDFFSSSCGKTTNIE